MIALAGGAKLQYVQAIARHKDPRMTLRYDHNKDALRPDASSAIVSKLRRKNA